MAAPMQSRFLVALVKNVRICSSYRLLFRPSVIQQVIYRQNAAPEFQPWQRFTTSTLRLEEVTDQSEEKTVGQGELSEAELLHAIEYLQSEEYREKYGDKPVWANYKRNHKGRVAPMKTRKTCIRGHGEKAKVCGNPCPVCRDSNLVIHYKNVKLLEQFICPHSWNMYSTFRTGVCRKQYKNLIETIEKARKHGLIPYSVPFMEFNYDEYMYQEQDQAKSEDKDKEEITKAAVS